MTTSLVYAGPDYDSMLNHSINRWAENIEYLHNESSESDVLLIYLCKENKNALNLVNEFSVGNTNIKEGEWLDYTFQVSVRTAIPKNESNWMSWLRRQFYLGVAYQCDMDGLQKVKQQF